MKILKILFPFFDHLYIFQLLEYQPLDFLRWFIKNPLKRNLQRKNKLGFTSKSMLLSFVGPALIIAEAVYLNYQLFDYINFLFLILVALYLFFLSPFYIILASFLILPIELYFKTRLLNQSKTKIINLKDLKVIAIVGSYAKTSVKNMLYTLLWKDFRVVKTPKSYNTEISIARTIIEDLKDNTQIFLVEMDAYHPREIKKLCELVQPDMGIITAIAPQHLERFGSMEKLAKTQFELADNLEKNGVLFLNSSDEWSVKLAYDYQCNKIFFGTRETDSVSVSNIRQTGNGLTFMLRAYKESVNITLPLFGKHNAINFLAAAAIAYELGFSFDKIGERAKFILPTPHRLEVRKINSRTIIDNSYNTNPSVSRDSLKMLKEYPGKNKFLITPGLVELGKEHSQQNQTFAKEAAKVSDQILIVGKNAKDDLLKGLEGAKFPKERTRLVESTNEGLELFYAEAKEGDVLLIENDLPDQYS